MTDKELRPLIFSQLAQEHPGAVAVEEFVLFADRRADIAVVNDLLWGYEIKSSHDRLDRLPLQVPVYDATFNYCCAIVADKFVSRTRQIVPRHWGISRIVEGDGEPAIDPVRSPRFNKNTTARGVAWLLLKSEAVRVLRSVGNPISSRCASYRIWDELLKLPRTVLDPAARAAFRARKVSEGRGRLLLNDG